MSALSELGSILSALNVSWETGAFKENAPDEYVVLVPIGEQFDILADNRPVYDIQRVRLSLFSKGNYNSTKNKLVRSLLDADFFFSDRRYIGYDSTAGYHQYVLDVAKHYEME